MRSTLIFRAVPEGEKSDSWEDVSRYLSEYLANKVGMDLYKVDMQVSRVHRSPKSLYRNKCRPIFVQIVNWSYAEDIRKNSMRFTKAKIQKCQCRRCSQRASQITGIKLY